MPDTGALKSGRDDAQWRQPAASLPRGPRATWTARLGGGCHGPTL